MEVPYRGLWYFWNFYYPFLELLPQFLSLELLLQFLSLGTPAVRRLRASRSTTRFLNFYYSISLLNFSYELLELRLPVSSTSATVPVSRPSAPSFWNSCYQFLEVLLQYHSLLLRASGSSATSLLNFRSQVLELS